MRRVFDCAAEFAVWPRAIGRSPPDHAQDASAGHAPVGQGVAPAKRNREEGSGFVGIGKYCGDVRVRMILEEMELLAASAGSFMGSYLGR